MSAILLETLPPRPPTPPREPAYDPMADAPLKQVLARQSFDPRLNLQTPPNGVLSPKSTATESNPSSRRSGKNVAFASDTQIREAPIYDAENKVSPPSGPFIPSSKASKPQKGILKPFLSPNPLDISFNTANGVTNQCSLMTMLESSARRLAGDDRIDKMDAYGILSRALRASNNLPDRVALQERMPRFMEFIQRDITVSPLDSSLTNHALTFLLTILHFPGVASSLSNEFGIFMIDHCIRSFGDSSVPKDVTRHLLQVVAQQNFSQRVMTPDRVGRLLTALGNIEQHVTGKSIIHSRIMIYRRLVKQCKPLMLVHTGWLHDLLTDSLSSTKDIRGAAIVLGFEAASSIGKDRQVSKKLAELFQAMVDDQKYIDFYIERLKTMLRSRQDAPFVPKIWSVVLLLLRGIQLDKWQYLNQWLRVIQQCFNSSDMPTKQEANFAWNRFVYVLHFEESSYTKLLGSTLCQPVGSQWKRKASALKVDDNFRNVVFGSACNLFYYTFRPGVSPGLVDKYWDVTVKPVMQQLCANDQPEERVDQAISILTGLFDNTTRRPWVEDRVLTNPLADASELPPLEPKWLRHNASRVFGVVQPILDKNFADLANPDSLTLKMWQTLIASVSAAASKEIKVSFDTTEFISYMFTSLLRYWKRGIAKESSQGQDIATISQVFLSSIREFVGTVVEAFGFLPFTEKQLCSRQDTFTPATTPSHRNAKATGIVKAPIQHLFTILSTIPDGIPDNEVFSDFFIAVFTPFFKAKNAKAASELAQEMLNSIPVDSMCPYGPWVMVADLVKAALTSGRPPNGPSSSAITSSLEPPVGREYRDLCRILERGYTSTPNLPFKHWSSFLDAVETQVTEATGPSGRALALVEPLAKTIVDHVTTAGRSVDPRAIQATTAMLRLATQPRDRQTVDAARMRLWGTASAKSASFDPFDNLYKLSNTVMEELYKDLDNDEMAALAAPFLTELDGFFRRCNSGLAVKTVCALQDGLVFWVKDDEARLSSRQSAETAASVKQIWDQVCDLVSTHESNEKINLESFERLFCAAFQSKHRHVVNSVAMLWNRIFHDAQEITYPEALQATLLSIRSMVDLVLPGLEESSGESAAAQQQHAFVQSQDDMGVLNVSPTKSSRSERVHFVSSGSSIAPIPAAPRSENVRTETGGRTKRQPKSKPKLRHEDSQIQFEPVQPAASAGAKESQVLTEHQLEVREQQRGQEVFYNMRPSSTANDHVLAMEDANDVSSPVLPDAKKETPKKQKSYEDYISSTPTPRRGQMLPLHHDVEMSDPPSSPPELSEVRRYPLVPEMRSRSNSVTDNVHWEFSSSPVSGSPLPMQRVIVQQEEPEEEEMENNVPENSQDPGVVADSFVMDVVPSSAAHENQPQGTDKQDEDKLKILTPSRRRTRQSVRQDSEQQEKREQQQVRKAGRQAPSTPPRETSNRGHDATPKSDNDEFVDAPSSPQTMAAVNTRQASKASAPLSSNHSGDTSYAISEGAERSMVRLAEEAEAKQAAMKRKTRRGRKASMKDCITVKTDDDEDDEDLSSSSGQEESGREIPSTPQQQTSPADAKSNKSSAPRRKRKRGSTSRQLDSRTKRRRSGGDDGCSITSSPSLRRLSSQGGGSDPEDDDVQSQVLSEHIAASQSQSRLSPELGEASHLGGSRAEDVEMVTGDDRRDSREASSRSKPPSYKIEKHFKKALEKIRTVSLSRDEMYRIEDMFLDFKRELYEAERRGRETSGR
ncbi:hypothetical protein jhhlp_000927 [Lomentospora prolificans]|uniref:Telomere-associated protein Rif1 N-terminal domain-containing protein n=1 Tax=Lomentospora prolificans TaxID=41688 RepID=A0A2N3NJV2_9PEZI|nr:hypothetical protein jhhlp_000927 [Lomentospora prolificans]